MITFTTKKYDYMKDVFFIVTKQNTYDTFKLKMVSKLN